MNRNYGNQMNLRNSSNWDEEKLIQLITSFCITHVFIFRTTCSSLEFDRWSHVAWPAEIRLSPLGPSFWASLATYGDERNMGYAGYAHQMAILRGTQRVNIDKP